MPAQLIFPLNKSAIRPVVLGIASGYSFAQLAPFVNSLSSTGYRGDIVFFVHRMKGDAERQLRAANVRTERFVHPPFRENPATRIWDKLPLLHPLLAISVLPLLLNIEVRRYALYRNFLRQHRTTYTHVLLADVSDVWFQNNPFDGAPITHLEAYAEDSRATLQSCHYNSSWIRYGFGDRFATLLADNVIYCSGTILSPIGVLLDYLEAFDHLLRRARSVRLRGVDQGLHNILVRQLGDTRVKRIPNGMGRVLTLAQMHPATLKFDTAEHLIGTAGQVVPIVHQYPRFPEVARRLLGQRGAASVHS